jgi:hypothetical protein
LTGSKRDPVSIETGTSQPKNRLSESPLCGISYATLWLSYQALLALLPGFYLSLDRLGAFYDYIGIHYNTVVGTESNAIDLTLG